MTAADVATSAADVAAALRTTATIRERAGVLLVRARSGESAWFTVDDAAFAVAAHEVAELTRSRFPDLQIPYHSRWRHFEAGGIDRVADLTARIAGLDAGERARTLIDVTLVSVLLDAGAGPDWSFRESSPDGDRVYTRSEGLGVASWHAFGAGLFSSDADVPLRVDAAGLRALTAEQLAGAFQVTGDNPLVGLDGRLDVLHRLGGVLAADPEVFGADGRPGGLFDVITAGGPVTAEAILGAVLDHLSPIWPSDNTYTDESGTVVALGDCWFHPALGDCTPAPGRMPFHKLSQWLTYSLIEPLELSGYAVTGLDGLTGLPEYRNGGLLLDTGVLTPLDPAFTDRAWQVDDEAVVEWRALTVALLDEIADAVRAELGVTATRLPLACVLEGGTWAAGRVTAARLRGGLPPFTIVSDGTVF
ncbi:DUF1688 family protein [Gordonia amarae]|uniref:Uracil phosphoribosyltransferase n=2 Tax=Gordonia amarae TaxID=36821 RepID=G7GJ44_9ACTN|nr:URC4/urg3 family protein [Gordonia amarae]MCS3879273.1 hypothetical protein [Gordonia amarae]QHN17770.1 DUF1688 family protein [Gordonia amarae]QHN22300.1 DUF1688 family protein [Gordonia amarae]QHN39922.1 DUF1688 family protein [Gordonia amarae]GAB03619.1 hypothetical protein GOAMR_03_01290 [Gordonia amarae NBRC 15530]